MQILPRSQVESIIDYLAQQLMLETIAGAILGQKLATQQLSSDH